MTEHDPRAVLWMADKLNSEDGNHARGVRSKLVKMAFEAERPASALDRAQPPQDRAWPMAAVRSPHISQRRPPSRGNATQMLCRFVGFGCKLCFTFFDYCDKDEVRL